jgi:hypothetical protein
MKNIYIDVDNFSKEQQKFITKKFSNILYKESDYYVDISEDIKMIFYIIENNEKFIISKDIKPIDMNKLCGHENLMKKVEDFEKYNIPKSGKCETIIAEIFRAINYIQYRAHNDGDLYFDINNYTYSSYIFIQSAIKKLLLDCNLIDTIENPFSDECKKIVWNGVWDIFAQQPISIYDMLFVLEDPYGLELNITKIGLMDLMSSGRIKDCKNDLDSRDFLKY